MLAAGRFVAEILKDQGSPRANFLTAVKLYHPNRVARRSQDIRRLANEVFLALKSNVPSNGAGQSSERAESHPEEKIKNAQPKPTAEERMRQARTKARRARASSGLQKQIKPFALPRKKSEEKNTGTKSENLAKEGTKNFEKEFLSAKENLDKGYFEQALLEFRQLSLKARHDQRLKIYICVAKSRLQLKKKDFASALKEIQKGEEIDPDHSAVLETQEMIKSEKKRGGFFSRFLK